MSDSDIPQDKQWAKKYILDPLTAPEPSQETGPGSHFTSPLGRSLSVKKDDSKLKNDRSKFSPTNPFSPKSPTSERGNGTNRPVFGRSNSTNYPPRSPAFHPPPNAKAGLGRSQSVRQPAATPSAGGGHARSSSVTYGKGKGLGRSGSLNKRYPGDMSHRPLDMIKREVRAADRAPHLRRKGVPDTDTIDGLDTIGGAYHHGGPYDATLASRNLNKMYSPVEAVKDSNMEAIRATPNEYIQDSLVKHVPLQGTAVIPPGGADMRGNVMKYDEGADLMREADAPGGAYKRWDHIKYVDEDLKGKGEPSYTLERDLKENKARQRRHNPSGGNSTVEYEMVPQQHSPRGASRKDLGAQVRQRSISSAAADQQPRPDHAAGPTSPMSPTSPASDLRRSNTTGRRITEGLKRRFGSLRRKKNDEDVY